MAGTKSIMEIAAGWLAAERAAVDQINEPSAQRRAREASAAYEIAIRAGTQEDLLLAVEQARKVQAEQEMGSQQWLEARSVTHLLEAEYAASR